MKKMTFFVWLTPSAGDLGQRNYTEQTRVCMKISKLYLVYSTKNYEICTTHKVHTRILNYFI